MQHFKIHSLPKLVLVTRNAEVLTTEGVTRLQRDPTGKKFPWPDDTFKAAFGDTFVKSRYVKAGSDKKASKGGIVEFEAIREHTFLLYFASKANTGVYHSLEIDSLDLRCSWP